MVTVWILGDQLLAEHPAVVKARDDVGVENIVILLIESDARARQQPYQQKKLVLLFSAMRHYAEELKEQGLVVNYVNSSSFLDGLARHLADFPSEKLYMMAASGYTTRQFQQDELAAAAGIPLELHPNTQFLVGRFNPIPKPEPDKRYVMEYFYRDMRRHFNLLMEDDNEPSGGAWNFDKENRRPLPQENKPPDDIVFEPDVITRKVMEEVAAADFWVGTVDGFGYGVTRKDAETAFNRFLEERLADFGPYEDAMTSRSHSLYHAVLTPYLNIGLLDPLTCAEAVEAAYRRGEVPINSAEGFIRQIIGWREFMFWQYWRQMPALLEKNAWHAHRPVPEFFWTAETEMRCLNDILQRGHATGYNHHIERLMVLSNFMMLTGIDPLEANNWFMAVYIDAYDWVMPPNVIGMALNADDGLTATKPYIASANYINKMSDYCPDCRFNHKKRHGEDACPFNFLYWNFILGHEQRLRDNPRLGRNVLGLRHLDEKEREKVRGEAERFFETLKAKG